MEQNGESPPGELGFLKESHTMERGLCLHLFYQSVWLLIKKPVILPLAMTLRGIPASSHAFLFSKFWNGYVEEIYSSVYRKTHHEKVLMALPAQDRI